MDQKIISIAPSTIILTLVVLAGAYTLWFLRDLALLVLTAIVLASAIEPGVAFFTRYRLPRILAVLFMYLVVLGAVFGSLYALVPPILDDAQQFISVLPDYLETIELPQTIMTATETSGFFSRESVSPADGFLDSLFALRESFSDASRGVIQLVATFFGGIFSLVLVIILSFYFAVQETGVEDFLRLVTPARHEDYVIGLWHRSQRKIGLWMQGQLLLSLIAGLLIYLGLLIMEVPYALLLAVVGAVAELIPVFGTFISLVPAVVVAFGAGGAPLALIVGGLFVIVNQFQSNLIYPLVVKKIVGVPALLVILALIVGGQVAGFLGILLSVPVAAALQEFLADVDRGKRARMTAGV